MYDSLRRASGIDCSRADVYTPMKIVSKHPNRRPGHRRGKSDDRGYNYSGDVFQVNLCHSQTCL
jgi:hypothetical protein